MWPFAASSRSHAVNAGSGEWSSTTMIRASGKAAVGENGADAALGGFEAAMDRDDDVGEDASGDGQGGVFGRQVVADIERLLGPVAARHAELEVIEQGIDRGVGMLLHVVDGVEPWVGVAQLRRAGPHVMQQRD